MADFKTHVTFSSVLGCGYAFAGMTAGVDMSTSLVAGGLCGVSGMLPDVDSDSGIPRRETMGFAAAIVPMLMVHRFQEFNLTHDQMVLSAAGLYFGIRFGLSKLIGRFSVHRGMWHSIPAALIFAGLAFLITGTNDLSLKYFKAFAVFLGTMSHLVLDEVYSVDTRGVVPRFKKSFGTAVKFWGKSPWANFSTYAKLIAVMAVIFGDTAVRQRFRENHPEAAGKIQALREEVRGFAQEHVPSLPQQGQQPWGQAAAEKLGWGQANQSQPNQGQAGWGAAPQQPSQPAWGQQPHQPRQPFAPITPAQPQGGFTPNNGGYAPPPPRYNYQSPTAQQPGYGGGWNQR